MSHEHELKRTLRVTVPNDSLFQILDWKTQERLSGIIRRLDTYLREIEREKGELEILLQLKDPVSGQDVLARVSALNSAISRSIQIFFGEFIPTITVGLRTVTNPPNTVCKFISNTAIVTNLTPENERFLEQIGESIPA